MKKFLLLYAKKIVSRLPAFVGTRLAGIPFQYRLGNDYIKYNKGLEKKASEQDVFLSMKNLTIHAYENVYFYRKFYDNHGFNPNSLSEFKDLCNIPILRKSDLRGYSLEQRSVVGSVGIPTNTGGTSGQPLSLLIDSEAYAREWAHMHKIWSRLGYTTNDVKLTLRGMNIGDEPIRYNFIHNEFQVNAYCDFDKVVNALELIVKKYSISYLHGYPSAIYEFLLKVSQSYPDVMTVLKSSVKGVFLGSELPAGIYRNFIEESLGVKAISWYGHSEMCVLAGEMEEKDVYFPFHSYGYAEACKVEENYHLIGSTLHNWSSPLIRYDTEDLIEPVSVQNGFLSSFKIKQGRIGEFVEDFNSRKISLTALIFGRHHKIFEYADFIQVSQFEQGELTIWITSSKDNISWSSYFDSKEIAMNIEFVVIDKPFKTSAGKTPLIVNKLIELVND
ncbi:hypothetical protein [Neptunomonas japonica]|uniref:Phenylacetate-CoA ligase n=1 Tax=Neptunomonas japonica JAMM 1380 TaxID=1441457 RepID=A0A7R6PLY5_9GAMM|nr:hypothetical protein [Neptunomonas japonica]BBB28872.1 phenylacetate-CoA ligase [Neptunomonas japonica JAMM 1380]